LLLRDLPVELYLAPLSDNGTDKLGGKKV